MIKTKIGINYVVECIFYVEITTGKEKGAGTDDTIEISMGKADSYHVLKNELRDNFESGR